MSDGGRRPEDSQAFGGEEYSRPDPDDEQDQLRDASFMEWSQGQGTSHHNQTPSERQPTKLAPLGGSSRSIDEEGDGRGVGELGLIPSFGRQAPGFTRPPPKDKPLTPAEEELKYWLKEQALSHIFDELRAKNVSSIEDIIFKVDAMMLSDLGSMSRMQASLLLSSIKMQKMLINVHQMSRQSSTPLSRPGTSASEYR